MSHPENTPSGGRDAYLEVRRAIQRALRRNPEGPDAYAFDTEALHHLILDFDRHLARPTLADAVESALCAAHELEVEHASPGAAAQLIRIVERDVVIEGLQKIHDERQSARDEAVLRSARELARIRGEATSRRRRDSDGPLKIGTLDFPKRM